MPGPGNYISCVNLAGKAQQNTVLKNQPSNAFPKSNDRFRRTGFTSPAPGSYTPKTNLNQNIKSEFKFMGATKFTQSNRTFIDIHWDPKQKATLPAPGHY